ncbi:hypothetical protein GW846_03905 [Candidatus Gracilibacteria bacterium]|nr:hypothetical protein [Candidatus Gracilibacteria bacterium]
MSTQKINFQKYVAYTSIAFFIVFAIQTYAADIPYTISTQGATQSGSNNSIISTNSSWSGALSYVNKGDNSSVIGNYFTGIYYDSVYGFFKTDWSSTPSENVRVIDSTSKCSSGYGYKLGGFAKSEDFGYVDFDYNSNIYVYYCVSDGALHGYSYSLNNGFQNFEGIAFEIQKQASNPSANPSGTGVFVNDESTITQPGTNSLTPNEGNAINSNFTPETIQNDSFKFESVNESLFYIIK